MSCSSLSQFPLCNRYVGEWRNGQREGQGTFHYARSEGSQKLGWGLVPYPFFPLVFDCFNVLPKKRKKNSRDREGERKRRIVASSEGFSYPDPPAWSKRYYMFGFDQSEGCIWDLDRK